MTELVEAQNTYELESNLIWNTIREILQAKEIPHKPQSYDTVEFGIISQKEIIQALKEVFGASSPKKRHGNSRALVFDKSKLDRLSKIYDIDIQVQVVTGSDSGSPHSPHLPHLPHVGLDRHLEEQPHDNKMRGQQEQTEDISKEKDANHTKIISAEHPRDIQHPQQVAEAAEVADAISRDSGSETEDKNKIIAQFIEENGIDVAIKELLPDI